MDKGLLLADCVEIRQQIMGAVDKSGIALKVLSILDGIDLLMEELETRDVKIRTLERILDFCKYNSGNIVQRAITSHAHELSEARINKQQFQEVAGVRVRLISEERN
jgi:hypothetical protein